jgi:3-oxoacyl-[acyl-carrier-protein] synthase-1
MDTMYWSGEMSAGVRVCGMGARTPLGYDSRSSAAAVRAGISALSAYTQFFDKQAEPVLFACDPALNPTVDVGARMEHMLFASIDEALLCCPKNCLQDLHCIVGLPEPRPGLPSDIASRLTAALGSRLRVPAARVRVVQSGHAAGLIALQMAASSISSRTSELCLVAAVDSYHDPLTVEWLDYTGRLMSSTNRNGFAPAEAAGACLLASPSAADHENLPTIAAVASACTSLEPHSIRSDRVCVGEGLSSALKQVLSILRQPEQRVTATYCDLNGERYRNEELVYSMLRTQEAFVDAHDYFCPADCWGDVGAASGLLYISLALEAAARGYATGERPLLWAGSESGLRSALLLHVDKRRALR